MSRKKRTKKPNNSEPEIWSEEQYEEYMKGLYGLEHITGYTDGGVPYGILLGEGNEEVALSGVNQYFTDEEELPFD